MSEVTETLAEVRDRVIRMESRIVQLGDYVGANLRSKQRIDVKRKDGPGVYVEIDALDVSISRIVAELRNNGVIRTEHPIDVFLERKRVATVYLK